VIVIENKCCEKIKIKMLKFEFELVLYLRKKRRSGTKERGGGRRGDAPPRV
jgi:hypothetical protein